MKYLFLSILMIGVGIGLVGCEDDNDDLVEEEGVDIPRHLDIRGQWYIMYTARSGTRHVLIRQAELKIMVSDESTSDSTQDFSANGAVAETRQVEWQDNEDYYSGVIGQATIRMDGTVSNQTTGATTRWAAGIVPEQVECEPSLFIESNRN